MRNYRQRSAVYAALNTSVVLIFLAAHLDDAFAQPVFGSTYSTTAAANCWSANGSKDADEHASRICRGKAGLVVSVTVDDLRQTLSVGRNRTEAAQQPAAQAWFGPFSSASTRVEWRMAGSEPFATIQRWQIADQSDPDPAGRPQDKPLLIVTRLPPGQVCHVAYIDAAANPDANELARQAADEIARGFDCGKDQVKIVGNRGRAVELATQH